MVHIVPNKDNQMVRPFIQQVKRCEEALAKIKTIERTVQDKKIGVHRDFISEYSMFYLEKIMRVYATCGKFMRRQVGMKSQDLFRPRKRSIGFGHTSRSCRQERQTLKKNCSF